MPIRSTNYGRKKTEHTRAKKRVHIPALDLKKQYKVGNFGQKERSAGRSSKGGDPLVSQGEVRWSLKQPCQLLRECLRPSHNFIKRVPATEERYVRTLSDCIPTSHKRCRRRIKIGIMFLYIYEFFVICPAVQYTTILRIWVSYVTEVYKHATQRTVHIVTQYTVLYIQQSLQKTVNRLINTYRSFPGLLAGPSGIRIGWGIKQWQIRGRKAPNFGWATFGWASCNLCPRCIALDLGV